MQETAFVSERYVENVSIRNISNNECSFDKVKPNFGHSEAASALTSIFKVVLALETELIPATVGVKTINPKIRVGEWNMRIVTDNEPWPSSDKNGIRRASINSFGYGGANAHAILVGVNRAPEYAIYWPA